jgi:transposase
VLSGFGQGRIFLAAGATDMRKSFNGLSGLVRSRLAGDPLSGDLFVFCNRSKNRLKILYFDSTGLWVMAKRLERGTFDWPAKLECRERIELRYEKLLLILNGLEAGELVERRRWRRRAC